MFLKGRCNEHSVNLLDGVSAQILLIVYFCMPQLYHTVTHVLPVSHSHIILKNPQFLARKLKIIE